MRPKCPGQLKARHFFMKNENALVMMLLPACLAWLTIWVGPHPQIVEATESGGTTGTDDGCHGEVEHGGVVQEAELQPLEGQEGCHACGGRVLCANVGAVSGDGMEKQGMQLRAGGDCTGWAACILRHHQAALNVFHPLSL